MMKKMRRGMLTWTPVESRMNDGIRADQAVRPGQCRCAQEERCSGQDAALIKKEPGVVIGVALLWTKTGVGERTPLRGTDIQSALSRLWGN